MEINLQKVECTICFEYKNCMIPLKHINPKGNVSGHKICNDCYKSINIKKCPFCRGKITMSKQPQYINSHLKTYEKDPDMLRIAGGLGFLIYNNLQ